MGTEGMSFSLQSRDLIADSIETVRWLQRQEGVTRTRCDFLSCLLLPFTLSCKRTLACVARSARSHQVFVRHMSHALLRQLCAR